MARYPAGQPIRISWTIKDLTGALVNPTAQTLTLLKPDQSTETFSAPSTIGTGLFYQDISATSLSQVGPYQWKVVSTGTGAGVVTGGFDVVDPFATELISVEDAKDYLRKSGSSTADDDQLERMIAAVTDAVEAYIGPVGRRTVTEIVYPASGVLHPAGPVLTVTSITPYAGVALGAGTYTLLPDGTIAPAVYSTGFYAAYYTVVYVAGRTSVPAAVGEAALAILGHLWSTSQRGGSASPQIIGAASADLVDVGSLAFSYLKSYGVRELLGSYARPPGTA